MRHIRKKVRLPRPDRGDIRAIPRVGYRMTNRETMRSTDS
jgi:hypothetical protein